MRLFARDYRFQNLRGDRFQRIMLPVEHSIRIAEAVSDSYTAIQWGRSEALGRYGGTKKIELREPRLNLDVKAVYSLAI
jgi:hypothetical protein